MTPLCFLSAVLTATVLAAPAPAVDYQKKADAAAWEWRPERLSVLYSVMEAPREYEVAVVRPKDTFGELTIRFTLDDKTNYTWQGHAATPFVVRDKVLYYADYNPYSSGCVVVAYDLENKKQLWKTALQGLGPIEHTKYHNAVQLDMDGDALRVFSQESQGKYVEYVDLKQGKTVGHKLYKE